MKHVSVKVEDAKRRPLGSSKEAKISIDRLEADIIELGEIGYNPEDRGVYRMAFTEADFEGRRWLMKKITEAGLKPSMDGAGNVFGLDDRAGTKSSFLVGSHIDSVPQGGMVDGTLGVLAALECMRVIKENNIELKENLELVATSDEEGRFGAMLGVQAIVGDLSPKTIDQAKDIDGIMLIDAMKAVGMNPRDILRAKRPRDFMSGFLELHIEQGPVLEHTNCDIGVVDNISGIFKWKITLEGEANHSGTTPMNLRRDAFSGLAEFAAEVPRILEENGSENARATIGKVDIVPGHAHTIPGKVEFSFVGRDFSKEHLNELEEAFRKAMSAIARRRKLMFSHEEISRIQPTPCHQNFIKAISDVSSELDLKSMILSSGAGHDAQYFGRYMPMGMLFIPSQGGISHSPDEWSSIMHIEAGASVLLKTLLKLLRK